MRRVVIAVALLLGLAASAGADETDRPAWATALRLRGRLAEEFAYRLHDPGDVYDAVFDATDRYPANVERDQKTDISLREALLAVGHGDFDARIGRQQIVWGEAISVFVTDVVNPKDFREFVLPDFSELRIPIWALDASYRLAEGLSLEAVWTPDTMSNRLPKQGAEFQFARPRFRFRNPVVRLPDDQDEFSLERSEGGVRLSVLQRGWDLSLIYYDQADKTPVFFARRVSQPAGPDIVVIEPRHPRLHIVGATLGKSVEPVVVRAEAALSIGKRYETTDPLDPDGVVRRDTLDWLVGVDYTFFERVDTALQLSQKVLMGSATNLTRPGVAAPVTTSVALRVTTGFFDNTLTPTLLFVVGVNRGDFRLSPRIDYLLSQAVTLSLGADLFEGPRLTLYGQFDRNDRVTLTTTWRF
ncbi:MAG: hypothetical protein DME02_11615 [Candidatus Rokuibacteriota bacterium]|nr:MAG: hypothetical protein DME02_11615 [Candidatus Rokubacteria bacterium]